MTMADRLSNGRQNASRWYAARAASVAVLLLIGSLFASKTRADVKHTSGLVAAGTVWETPFFITDTGINGPALFVTGGLHGNEPAGYRAAEQIRHWPLKRGKLIVVPCVNRPGITQHTRWMPGEPDTLKNANRNFPRTGQPNQAQSVLIQSLWQFLQRQHPDWVVDLHEGFDFHISNPKSDGSSVIFFDTPAMQALAAKILSDANASVEDPKRKFVGLSKSGPINGGLVRAAVERLGAKGFCFETTFQYQPLSIRTRQHRIMMHRLMRQLDMAAGPANVMTDGDATATIDVALYDAGGTGTRGIRNLERILDSEPQFTLNHIGPADMRSEVLDQFDVIIFPGGSGSKEAAAIGPDGRAAVRQFVQTGGGYIGICAGAYLATARYSWSLAVINAKTLTGRIDVPGAGTKSLWFRGGGTVEMDLTDAGRGILGDWSNPIRLHYENGPILSPADQADLPGYRVLAVFRSEVSKYEPQKGTMVNTPAILAAPFGNGRVLVISPHPEATAGLERLVERAILWTAGTDLAGTNE